MSVRKLLSFAWAVAGTANLVVVGMRFVDETLINMICDDFVCIVSFIVYFAFAAMEFWCVYALVHPSSWVRRSLVAVSSLLALWWLAYFAMNDDRSIMNLFLVAIPQVLLAVVTIVLGSTTRRQEALEADMGSG